jgi:hypothetical protein
VSSFTSGADLFDGLLKGQVPHQIRLFAAQGLLPISREELLRLQIVLTADPDRDLAEIAESSVREVDEDVLLDWVKDRSLGALELDLLIRVRREESLWSAAARHPSASDETLRVLAKNASPVVQDIIITNQTRVMGCLEILEDLKVNPQVSQVVLRRVREFEEEFIEKALADEIGLEEEVEEGPSIEDALGALMEIGAHIPYEDDLEYPEWDDPYLREAVERGGSAFVRILNMDIKERILAALKGTREERAIFINSRNRLVVNAVLSSPKLSDLEVERFAASRSVSDDVIRGICSNPKWTRRYGVIYALTHNPKTPVKTALHMLPNLNIKDLRGLVKDRNAHPVVRRQAKNMAESRR